MNLFLLLFLNFVEVSIFYQMVFQIDTDYGALSTNQIEAGGDAQPIRRRIFSINLKPFPAIESGVSYSNSP